MCFKICIVLSQLCPWSSVYYSRNQILNDQLELAHPLKNCSKREREREEKRNEKKRNKRTEHKKIEKGKRREVTEDKIEMPLI